MIIKSQKILITLKKTGGLFQLTDMYKAKIYYILPF